MRIPAEWDEAYILSLPTGEHDWVEFKGTQALDTSLPEVDGNQVLDELSKQLSAFSNSGGGTIVYGVSNLRQVDRGGVSLALKNGTKEWLEDVIPHLVEFALRRFNVYVVQGVGRGSGIAAGKGLIVIDVPDSEDAPHQARDKKYYARVSGKSRPIGHRLVLDMVGRRKHPVMMPSFSIGRRGDQGLPELRMICENTGRVFANYVNGWIKILPDESSNQGGRTDDRVFYFDNTDRDVVGFVRGDMASHPLHVTRYDPVLPGLRFRRRFGPLLLHQAESTNQRSHRIAWAIHADNAAVREGEVAIGDLPWED